MNKLHSLLSEAEKSFEEKFVDKIHHNVVLASPDELIHFYRTTLKQALQAILEAAPPVKVITEVDGDVQFVSKKGFNQGREQSLSIIKEFLRGEDETSN